MAMNASSKFDHITYKALILSGCPTIYQLKPEQKTAGSLRMMTIGKRDPAKRNKTMLLVGETGTGKSTLIDALVNYAMGVKFEDDVWFQIVEDKEEGELKNRSQIESQTCDVTIYQIFGFEGVTLPFSLTIIDTPGYGDTRDIEKDDIVKQRLFSLFRSNDGIHDIDAVGLVLKAGENRVSDRLRYIFDSVMSLFGKDIQNNIVALITHSDGMEPENVLKALESANIKYSKDKDNNPVYFMFNNRQTTTKTKKYKNALKSAWDLTTGEIRELADFMDGKPPQNLHKTVEVLSSRIKLTACIQNLRDRITLREMKQKEIQQTQESLRIYKEQMKNNENFVIEVDEPYIVQENIKGGWWGWGFWGFEWKQLFYEGAVTCFDCKETCHYPGCTVAASPSLCEVMKDGKCTSCTKGCPVSRHVKEEWIYVNKTKKVQKTLQDVKDKYETNKAGSNKKLSFLETLQNKMLELQQEKEQLLEESFQLVLKLESIALNINSLSTHVHLDFLIERFREKGDMGKVHQLELLKHRVSEDKGIRAAMKYGFNKLTAAVADAIAN